MKKKLKRVLLSGLLILQTLVLVSQSDVSHAATFTITPTSSAYTATSSPSAITINGYVGFALQSYTYTKDTETAVTYSIPADSSTTLATKGLSFSPVTGLISGTPVASLASTYFNVSATTGLETATSKVTISITIPTFLPDTVTVTGYVGEAITYDTLTANFTPDSWTVSPSLPSGLSLDTSTTNLGVIKGTPASTDANSYVITAINTSLSVSESLTVVTVFIPRTSGSIGSGTAQTYYLGTTPVTVDATNAKFGGDTTTITLTIDTASSLANPVMQLIAVDSQSALINFASGAKFDQPLVITLPWVDTATASPTYSRDGLSWNKIPLLDTTTAIDRSVMDTLSVTDGYQKVGSNLVIYTLHLTAFGTRLNDTVTASASATSVQAGNTVTLSSVVGIAADTGTVTFTSTTGCSITAVDSRTATLKGDSAGTCTVTATKAAAGDYIDATDSLTVTVTAAPTTTSSSSLAVQPSLAITSPGDVDINKSVTLLTTGGATSGTNSFSGGTASVCTVTSAGVVTTSGVGTCSVSVTRTAAGYYSITATVSFKVRDLTAEAATQSKAQADQAAADKAAADAAAAEAAKKKAAEDAQAAADAAAMAKAKSATLVYSSKKKLITYDLPDKYANLVVWVRVATTKGKKTTYRTIEYTMLGDNGEGSSRIPFTVSKGSKIQILLDNKILKSINV